MTEPEAPTQLPPGEAALARAVTPWQRVKGALVYCLRTPMLTAGLILLLAPQAVSASCPFRIAAD
jgi:hypothetical protein